MNHSFSPEPEGLEKIFPSKEIGKEIGKPPNPAAFQAYMESASPLPPASGEGKVSPMDLAKTSPALGQPTFESVLGQMDSNLNTLNNLQNNLKTPNIKFTRSQSYLVNSKLEEANSHIRSASAKVGANMLESTPIPKKASTGEKFLNYLTDGQDQLLEAKKQLEDMGRKGQSLAPTDFLLVQIKLSQAQQALEYSSVVVSMVTTGLQKLFTTQIS